jgi:hypothetical protein
LFEKNQGWRKIKATLTYLKDEQVWELRFGGERIPVGEDIFNYLFDKDKFIIWREGPNKYTFINPNLAVAEEFLTGKPKTKKENVGIPTAKGVEPEEIARALLRATERRERFKSFWEKNMPLLLMGVALVCVGIFIAIVWSSTGESFKTISANFKDAMQILNNITQTQLEILREARGVATLPTRP